MNEMPDELKRFWENKLLEMAQEPKDLFRCKYQVTWRQRIHNKYLDIIDRIYEKLTGHNLE